MKMPAAVLSLFVFAFSIPAFAEEPPKEAYGMVKGISKNELTVTVYDTEKGEAREEIFSLEPGKTQLAIVRPATEVVEGDEVKINYQEEKGKKKASFVSIFDLPLSEQKP